MAELLRRKAAAPVKVAPASRANGVAAGRGSSPDGRSLPSPARSLEAIIGGRWYALAGALVLIIGLGIGYKWAYDAGLLRLSPELRCSLGAAFGVLLVIAGEIVRRRFGPWPGVGATSAGIGSIYVAAYVAYRLYSLVSPATAFGLLAAIAIVGILLGARARLAAIGVVSLLGGYITPLLFYDVPPTPLVLPGYLLCLLAIALVLCMRLGRLFAPVRVLAWIATAVLGGAWTLGSEGIDEAFAPAFLAIVWGAFHTELVWSAKHGQLGVPRGEWRLSGGWRAWRPIVVSISTTTWATVLGIATIRSHGVLPDWSAPGALMVACAGLWITLAGHLRLLRDGAETDAEALGLAAGLQTGALLIVTVALAISGGLQVVVWIAMCMGALGASKVLQAKPVAWFGIASLVMAGGRLVLIDYGSGALSAPSAQIGGLSLSPWTTAMLVTAGCWFAAGMLYPMKSDRRVGAVAFSIIGTLLLMASLASPTATPLSLCTAWIVFAAALFGTRDVFRPLNFKVCALLPLAGATTAMLSHAEEHQWAGPGAALLLHPEFLIAGLGVGVGAWIALATWRDAPARFSRVIMGVCVALAFCATSAEAALAAERVAIDQAVQGAGVSMWWGIFALVLLVAGFRFRLAPVRWCALGLMAIAGLKAVVLDLGEVPMFWRFVSFVALGLLMILVPIIYTRLERMTSQRAEAPATPPPIPAADETAR